jgi:hypothetical protein
MALELLTIEAGYNLASINANFQTILEYINTNCLLRTEGDGGENTLSSDIDANSNTIINLPDPVDNSDAATKGWVLEEIAAAIGP